MAAQPQESRQWLGRLRQGVIVCLGAFAISATFSMWNMAVTAAAVSAATMQSPWQVETRARSQVDPHYLASDDQKKPET